MEDIATNLSTHLSRDDIESGYADGMQTPDQTLGFVQEQQHIYS